jgi:hypothetical protein
MPRKPLRFESAAPAESKRTALGNMRLSVAIEEMTLARVFSTAFASAPGHQRGITIRRRGSDPTCGRRIYFACSSVKNFSP